MELSDPPVLYDWRKDEWGIEHLDSGQDMRNAKLTAEHQMHREVIRALNPPPSPLSPPGLENIEKFSKISENSSEKPNISPEISASISSEEAPVDAKEPELVLDPVPPEGPAPEGFRIISPRRVDRRLTRMATREGCPVGISPLEYLLQMVANDPPPVVNGPAYVMWESMRLKAATALLPYMHPRVAPIEMDEGSTGHEAALDELE